MLGHVKTFQIQCSCISSNSILTKSAYKEGLPKVVPTPMREAQKNDVHKKADTDKKFQPMF
jgi:hypothetical protein